MSHHRDSSDAGMMPQGLEHLVQDPDLLELLLLLVLKGACEASSVIDVSL